MPARIDRMLWSDLVSLEGLPAAGLHDKGELRGVLGRFATGVTIVTAGRPVPCGMTANSFTSVSLNPPLVLVCVLKDAAVHRAITDGESFAVSVLADDQEQVARYFANRSRPRGEREFDAVEWTRGRHTGVPVISGNVAWLECRLSAVYEGGDHSIFLGSVLEVGRGSGGDALLFYGGRFTQLEGGESQG
jgi:flavin reductase